MLRWFKDHKELHEVAPGHLAVESDRNLHGEMHVTSAGTVGLYPLAGLAMSHQRGGTWSDPRFLEKQPWSKSHRRECDPPHPVDFVKSPQMSAVAAVAGLGCGQDTVAPPIDVPESEGWEEKRRQELDSSVFEGLSNPEISPVIPGG